MDLLKVHRRRSRLSDVAYISLNIAMALALFVIVHFSQAPLLAVLVMLLSKWRIFAVRPRFWFANLIANMVDIIVGVSTVILLTSAGDSLWLQVVITALYISWLLFIKPRSKREIVAIQAGVAVFVGVTALSIISYSWDSVFFVLAMWGIGYIAARHVLGSYDEPHTVLYSLIVGCIFAELGWIGFHWMMAYVITGFGQIQLSQLALFTTLFCLVADRAYASYHKHGVVRRTDILLPVILTGAVVVTTYIFALIFGTSAL